MHENALLRAYRLALIRGALMRHRVDGNRGGDFRDDYKLTRRVAICRAGYECQTGGKSRPESCATDVKISAAANKGIPHKARRDYRLR